MLLISNTVLVLADTDTHSEIFKPWSDVVFVWQPLHGSLLQNGKLFRYTPHRGFFGNDSFFYSFSDINQNVAIGTAFISVLCRPPQFVSIPVRLHVSEDTVNPKFGWVL